MLLYRKSIYAGLSVLSFKNSQEKEANKNEETLREIRHVISFKNFNQRHLLYFVFEKLRNVLNTGNSLGTSFSFNFGHVFTLREQIYVCLIVFLEPKGVYKTKLFN